MRSVWSIPLTRNWEKRHGRHPTQKPESLLERIILAASNPGDTVLDPFCGSGTTGVAALRHGRRFIGIDMDAHFLDSIARPRLKDELLKCNACADAVKLLDQPENILKILRQEFANKKGT